MGSQYFNRIGTYSRAREKEGKTDSMAL